MNTSVLIFFIFFYAIISTTSAKLSDVIAKYQSYEILYQFNYADYKFQSSQDRKKAIDSGDFIPKHNYVSGLAVYKNKLFVTTPRLRNGVPSTLNVLDYQIQPQATKTSELLEPFPSWEMQKYGNCKAFQNVLSVTLDQFERLWIVDSGLVNFLGTPTSSCPSKLVVIDLKSGQKIILNYEFPAAVVSPKAGILDDLIVVCKSKSNCWVYITNISQQQMVIYNMKKNISWSVYHSTFSPDSDPAAGNLTINGISYPIGGFGLDGIAISPKNQGFKRVYYTALASFKQFSILTKVLQKSYSPEESPKGNITLKDSDIRYHGYGISQVDGIIIDSTGRMFYGMQTQYALAYWQINDKNLKPNNEVKYVQSQKDIQFIDGLTFDNEGSILFSANNLERLLPDAYNTSQINMKIIRTKVGTKSYMYA